MSKTQIVIVGGGAAGLELARRLGARFGRQKHDVILVDRNRTHIWKPLLHEVAAGSLDASMDEVGYRSHCHRWGYRYFHGTFAGVDRHRKKVRLAAVADAAGKEIIGAHELRYDYLVLAFGSVTNTFGTAGVSENCTFLDTRAEADVFRDRLLDHCLGVSRAMMTDPGSDARVRVAIVGGGATGVELAAELVNAADGLNYYGLEVFDRSRMDIMLIEAGPRILPALPEWLSEGARESLEALGVKVLTATSITRSSLSGMTTASGEAIEADLQIWAAGVKGAPIPEGLDGLELSRSDQLIVRPTLQTSFDDHVFAIGDCASCILPGTDRPVPPRAQAAHQMAAVAFENLCRLMKGKPLVAFSYRDHGSLVSLSRYSTVGSLMGSLIGGRMAIEGRLARLVYVTLYRMHMIAIHGWVKGLALIVLRPINKLTRPRLKLH